MTGVPLLVCLDVQRVFLMEGPLHAPHAGDALIHGRRLLSIARERQWNVAHCLLRHDGPPLAITGQGARPVEGFEPLSNEMVFERSVMSAYGHLAFESLMDRSICGVIVMGLSASITFIATVLDAFERGHQFIFAVEALAGQEGPRASAREHEAVARDVAGQLGFAGASTRQAQEDDHFHLIDRRLR